MSWLRACSEAIDKPTEKIMMRLRVLLPVLAYAILSGCSGGASQPSETSYHAQVTTDEEETEVQLLKFVEDGAESPTVEDLGTWRLGYGAMKYLVGQGSVPSWQTEVPPQCLNSSTLGTDEAGACVARPLLASFAPILRSLGIDKQDVTFNPMYSTNNESAYTQTDIDTMNERLDGFVSSQLGFAVAPAPDGLLDGGGLESYRHDANSLRHRYDWMGALDDRRTLSTLSIPGTHDSVSRYGGDIVQTQSQDLNTQLNSGIRAFDIRLKCTADGKALIGFHGDFYQRINFDDILGTMSSYLRRYPRESLVVRIKNEASANKDPCSYAGVSFQSVFRTYYERYKDSIWQAPSSTDRNCPTPNLTLLEMRGRIVILQDFSTNGAPCMGIGYSDLPILDDWAIGAMWDLYDKKWSPIKTRLGEMRPGTPRSRPNVTFLSASTGTFPYFFASGKSSNGTGAHQFWAGFRHRSTWFDFPHSPKNCNKSCSVVYIGTNELTMQWLRNASPKPRYTGIVFADFPGKDLIDEIIGANYR
jgi:1-phosphatidylinositol phosphodiesterase